MESSGLPIDVKIFGTRYRLRSDQNSESLKRLAKYVDRKMREIAPDPASADGMKVAVLAALNMADELEKLRECFEEREEQVEVVSGRLSRLLEGCLEEPAAPASDNGSDLDAAGAAQ